MKRPPIDYAFDWPGCDALWTRIAAHLPDTEFEALAAREGWYLVRWVEGHCELWGVILSDVTPGVLLCDGEPVGASGERYCYLGELTHREDGP